MKGLKGQEEAKFEAFFALVQEEANKQNATFFLFAGEGNELETEELSGENLSGWLIPNGKSEEFERIWKAKNICNIQGWDSYFCWAEWEKSENAIIIRFQFYE